MMIKYPYFQERHVWFYDSQEEIDETAEDGWNDQPSEQFWVQLMNSAVMA